MFEINVIVNHYSVLYVMSVIRLPRTDILTLYQSFKACKKKNQWWIVMDCFMIYCEGITKCTESWWTVVIYTRIREMFNVTDGRNKIGGGGWILITLLLFLYKELGLA